jgi:hypothetical protein
MPEGLKSQREIKKIFPTMEELEEIHPEVGMGGCWKPKECSAQQRVAIIIPYRLKTTSFMMSKICMFFKESFGTFTGFSLPHP